MVAIIGAVVFGRHLIQGQPAVFRLALVGDQGQVRLDHKGDDGIETRIINKDVMAPGVGLDHADVLPDLDRQRATGLLVGQVPVDGVRPAGRAEALHGKGRREVEVRRVAGLEHVRDLGLGHQGREVRIVDIDRQKLEIVRAGQFQERIVADIIVHMGVELMDPGEIRQGVRAVIGGLGGGLCRRQGGQGQDAKDQIRRKDATHGNLLKIETK
jgi:hypothetical protein